MEGHADIMYTFSRVEFCWSQKFEIIHLFKRENENEWHIVDDWRHVPLPNSASNVKLGVALDVGSEVEIGYFRFEI